MDSISVARDINKKKYFKPVSFQEQISMFRDFRKNINMQNILNSANSGSETLNNGSFLIKGRETFQDSISGNSQLDDSTN